jgi:hypothetical protein
MNATTHGITSSRPKDVNEKALIESFVKELVDYYDPQSPLEKLQIERIAICRAKLQYLYELEQVKLMLASKELEAQPEKILARITEASSLSRGMAKEFILEGQIYLPCRLDIKLLEDICIEIENISGILESAPQFARALPKLTKYLNQYPVIGLNNTDQWMDKLAIVAADLYRTFDRGEHYSAKWSELVEAYLLGKEYDAKLKKEAMQPEIDELEAYQEERRIARGEKPRKTESNSPNSKPNFPDQATLRMQLKSFSALLQGYQEAQQVVSKYHEIKLLMTKAISLPASESDLMMRYQTSLERRLSSAIGELLALQKSHR